MQETRAYAAPTDNKKSRIENRKVSKDALELKTLPPQERMTSDINKSIALRNILVLCTSEKVNITKLFAFLKEKESYDVNIYFRECIHIIPDKDSDIFVFRYGVCVFWGVSEPVRDSILAQQKFFEENSYGKERVEREDFRYGIVKEGSSIVNDVIYLDNESLYNKMIISNALAQSIKLDVFEGYAERTIESIREIPNEIFRRGRTNRSQAEIMKLTGLLHKLKFSLNLSTNILDTPEILWYYPNYTSLYESFKLYLELKSRTEIINQKCDVMQEVLTLSFGYINARSADVLEKVIILLLVVEIGIGLFSLLMK
ncbi:uncharacterized protein NEMAJ01_0205 [Nematocida major]|uniref:uncharacterized protein n=1 Tax=Nematocida major TaxID=1912982 RepID=UPI002007C9DF|nr:uncharacterized protein NEMAJ01_0205 [Nematocida major]KAH9385309.1 hypothetical protein NEMAJ01_0205 [Nematocida major]